MVIIRYLLMVAEQLVNDKLSLSPLGRQVKASYNVKWIGFIDYHSACLGYYFLFFQ